MELVTPVDIWYDAAHSSFVRPRTKRQRLAYLLFFFVELSFFCVSRFGSIQLCWQLLIFISSFSFSIQKIQILLLWLPSTFATKTMPLLHSFTSLLHVKRSLRFLPSFYSLSFVCLLKWKFWCAASRTQRRTKYKIGFFSSSSFVCHSIPIFFRCWF